MIISARVLPHSHIHATWRNLGQISGIIYNVPFMYKGFYYVAEEVDPSKLLSLQNHNCVVVEIMTKPPVNSEVVEVSEESDLVASFFDDSELTPQPPSPPVSRGQQKGKRGQ